mmetsp:Transcript_44484/g.139525  ORF Transcript_44484/g.139525 Transcript_44484/m.139525 type:complete len:287 (-) Transcript_44484:72-932(-)
MPTPRPLPRRADGVDGDDVDVVDERCVLRDAPALEPGGAVGHGARHGELAALADADAAQAHVPRRRHLPRRARLAEHEVDVAVAAAARDAAAADGNGRAVDEPRVGAVQDERRVLHLEEVAVDGALRAEVRRRDALHLEDLVVALDGRRHRVALARLGAAGARRGVEQLVEAPRVAEDDGDRPRRRADEVAHLLHAPALDVLPVDGHDDPARRDAVGLAALAALTLQHHLRSLRRRQHLPHEHARAAAAAVEDLALVELQPDAHVRVREGHLNLVALQRPGLGHVI